MLGILLLYPKTYFCLNLGLTKNYALSTVSMFLYFTTLDRMTCIVICKLHNMKTVKKS